MMAPTKTEIARVDHPTIGAKNMLISTPKFLRNVLWADALSCLACGLLQVAFTRDLSQWFGLPAAMLMGVGQFLLVYGAAVAFLATRLRVSNTLIWALIAGNALWAVGCLALLMDRGIHLSFLGDAYVIFQALTVAVIAQLQYLGVRQAKLA